MDGKPSYAESWPYVCVSGGVDSSERCVVHDPAPGVYWIAVHNYQGTGNTPDSHVLAITTVDDEGEGMTVTAPRTAGTGVPVDVHVQWDLPLPVDASHVAILGVGTSAMTPENVGRSVIELTRTGNDIRVEAEQQEVVGGEDIEYVVSLAPNGRNAHEYDLRFELPDGYSLIESDGTATRDGNSYAWKISQAANSGETNYRLVLQTAVVLQDTSLQLVLEHTRDGRPETASQSVAPSVAVLGGPIALIFGVTDATRGVTPGAKLRVDASMSRGLRDKSAVMYNWQQTAGEKAQLVDKGEGIFELEVPNRQVDLEYQLVISSEGRESAPAKLKVSVLPVSSGGGGFDILTLALLFTFVIFAGRRMILRCGRSAM